MWLNYDSSCPKRIISTPFREQWTNIRVRVLQCSQLNTEVFFQLPLRNHIIFGHYYFIYYCSQQFPGNREELISRVFSLFHAIVFNHLLQILIRKLFESRIFCFEHSHNLDSKEYLCGSLKWWFLLAFFMALNAFKVLPFLWPNSYQPPNQRVPITFIISNYLHFV